MKRPSRFTLVILAALCLGTVVFWKALGPLENSKLKDGPVTTGSAPPVPAEKSSSLVAQDRGTSANAVSAIAAPLTAEEKAAVQRQIDAAKAEVTRLKAQNCTFQGPFVDSSGRIDVVNVAPFSAAQIDALYTFLTQQGRAFPPGSPMARAFRKRADALVLELRTYTRMSVKKFTPQPPGLPDYIAVDLPDQTPYPVYDPAKRAFTVSGKSRTRITEKPGVDSLLEALFADAPALK